MPNAPTLGELESAQESMKAVISDLGKTPEDVVTEVLNGGTPEGATDGHVESDQRAASTRPEQAGEDKSGERTRDPKTGKFVAAGAGTAEIGVAEERPAGVLPDRPDSEGVAVVGDEEHLEPLPDWPAAQHDTFRALPKPAQQFVLDTIKAAQDKASEIAATGGKFAELEEIFAPRRDQLAREGLTEAGYIRQLVALSDFAGKDAPAFLTWFAQQRGIHLGDLLPQDELPIDGAEDDPVYQRLSQQNAALQARLDTFEKNLQNQQSTVEAQSQQRIASEIDGFGKAVDDKGRLQHPYFEQVKVLMGTLMKTPETPFFKPPRDLPSAYDMACRADPDVNAKIASAQRAQEERDRAKQQRVKAEAARQAGSSVSGTPGDRAPPEPSGDIREDMRRQFVERGISLS